MHKRTQRGFTIIELVVVLSVMALLVAVALSNVQSSLPHYRLLNASRRLAATIHMARTRAILNSLEHRVTSAAGGLGWQMEEGDQPFGSTSWSVSAEAVDLSADYYGVNIAAWPGDIICAPNGAVTSPGAVVLGTNGASEQISVSATPWGEVTLSKSGG